MNGNANSAMVVVVYAIVMPGVLGQEPKPGRCALYLQGAYICFSSQSCVVMPEVQILTL